MDFIPELNQRQLDKLADFLIQIAVVLSASLILPALNNVDKVDEIKLIWGLVLTGAFLMSSLTILRSNND